MPLTPNELTPNEVQVWQLRLDLPHFVIAALAPSLSAGETRRASRCRRDRDRLRFVAARGQLRAILGRVLDRPPHEIAFGYTPFGKPFLCGEASRLRFNLSHSGDIALLALAWDREVGIDIERIQDGIALDSLAARFLPPADAAAIFAKPHAERPPAFFRAWVRHEAALKALGTGFAAPAGASLPDSADWFRQDLEVGPGYRAALVVEGQPLPLKMRVWPE